MKGKYVMMKQNKKISLETRKKLSEAGKKGTKRYR